MESGKWKVESGKSISRKLLRGKLLRGKDYGFISISPQKLIRCLRRNYR